MRRSDAFWGSALVSGGVLLLVIPRIIPRESLGSFISVAFGVGIVMLGLSLAVKLRWLQIIAAVVAGICLGTTAAYAFVSISQQGTQILLSCNAQSSRDVDNTSGSDTVVTEPKESGKHVLSDTTLTKPIY